MDLADPEIRADLTERLMAALRRPPRDRRAGVLAGYTGIVTLLHRLGAARSEARSGDRQRAGCRAVPGDDDCVVVEVQPPPTANVTEELFALDHLARHLPDHAVAAIEAFDPTVAPCGSAARS